MMKNTVATEKKKGYGCDHEFVVASINCRGHNFLVRTPNLVFLVLWKALEV